MQNVAISRCCFVTFCKQRRRNEEGIITQTFFVLVSVADKVCSIKLRKPNKQPNNEQSNEHKKNEIPAEQTDG